MLNSYIKTAFRSLIKYKFLTLIQLIGLAVGMTCFLIILAYNFYERSFDRFHANASRIYRVQYNTIQNGQITVASAAAVPAVGPAFKNNFPEVIEYARFFPINGILTYTKDDGTSVAFREEKLQIATASVLEMFSFKLINGDSTSALKGPGKIVVSESASKRYFGDEDPIGKTLTWQDGDVLVVTGVMKNLPENSHLKFNFLISYETLNNQVENEAETSWRWYDFNTYILVKEDTDVQGLETRFAEWLKRNRAEDWKMGNYTQEFLLQPLTDIHLYSNLVQESQPEEQGNGKAIFFLLVAGFFILLVGWINYANISTTRSMERSKEVGIRKAAGASKDQLLMQFFAESFLLNLCAILLTLAAIVLSINVMRQLTSRPLTLESVFTVKFIGTAFGLFLTSSILTGLFPAVVFSSVSPIAVLKGNLSNNSFNSIQIRKALVIFQFAISIAIISSTFIFYNQIVFMLSRDLGVDIQKTVVLRGPGIIGPEYSSSLNSFKTEMQRHNLVRSVTASTNVPGDEIFWTRDIRKISGSEPPLTIYNVGIDDNYVPSFNLTLIEGRNFSESNGSDVSSVILNHSAIEALGFESVKEAINEKVVIESDTLTIIGAIKDFHQMSLKWKQAPIAFRFVPDANSFLSVKLETGAMKDILQKLEEKWNETFPGNPFQYFLLDEFFNRQYNQDSLYIRLFAIFSVLSIFIASLGLFGSISYSSMKRSKEFAMRKILGASPFNIMYLLSREFLLSILISGVIAIPLSYYTMNRWLMNYAYRVDLKMFWFILPILIVLILAFLTVLGHAIKAAKVNPSNLIRTE